MLGRSKHEIARNATTSATGDILTYAPPKPTRVTRLGLVQDGATDPGVNLVLAVDRRPTAGSDTDRAELMTMTPAAAIGQGKGIFKTADVAIDIVVGEEVVVEVKTAGAASSTAHVWIEHDEEAFAPGDNMVEVTA